MKNKKDTADLLQERLAELTSNAIDNINHQLFADRPTNKKQDFREKLRNKIYDIRRKLGEWIAGDYFTDY
jgi:hypothetical protein